VTGLDNGSSSGNSNQQQLQDFSVCITEDGILGSFEGTLQNGTKGSLTLIEYSTTVDPSQFTPPPGAQITDVGQISPK
jgi:hypothetical protein